MKLFSLLLMVAFSQAACEESNPYSGGYSKGSIEEDEDSSLNSSSRNRANGSGVVDEDATELAEDVSEEALTITDEICGNAALFAKVKGSYEAACVGGKPTVALVDALSNPYNGVGDPTITILQSDDVDGVSQFMVMTSMEVPVSPDEFTAQGDAINQLSFEEGNAVIEQTILSDTAGDGSPITQTLEILFDMTVSVAIITVQDPRILIKNGMKFGKDTEIQAMEAYLKAGVPENEDNIIADQLTFWMPSENGTTVITFSQQHAENRGQHETAEEIFVTVAQRQILETMSLFN